MVFERTAFPQTRWIQLLLVCFTSSCPKRRHPLHSAFHWLTHKSAILNRILSFPCTLWSWARLQAVQENAGGLKNAVPCVWLNRNMKMLLKKERTQLGNRWKIGKGKQAITGKIAKCCLGLGQIPVVRVYLSAVLMAAGSKACFQIYTPETSCPWAGTASQIQPWQVCWTVRAQKWDLGSLLLLVFASHISSWCPFPSGARGRNLPFQSATTIVHGYCQVWEAPLIGQSCKQDVNTML